MKKVHIWLFIISLLAAVHCTTAQEVVEEEVVDTLKKGKRNHIAFDLVWTYQNHLWPNWIKTILGWSWWETSDFSQSFTGQLNWAMKQKHNSPNKSISPHQEAT